VKTRHRLALGLSTAGLAGLVLGAVPAGAHIHAEPHEVPAGASSIVSFTTGHGCDGSPTNEIRIRIPEPIVSASPQWMAGWDAEKTMEALDEPVEQAHGDPLTERVAEITFTAQPGNELPDGQRGVYTITFTAPDTPGESLVFPVVQGCVEGESAWIEETVEGEDEPEMPAPIVTIGEASGGGHGEEPADDGDTATADDGEEAPATTEAASDDDGDDSDDGGSDGMAIAALALGAVGLATGGAALAQTRRKD